MALSGPGNVYNSCQFVIMSRVQLDAAHFYGRKNDFGRKDPDANSSMQAVDISAFGGDTAAVHSRAMGQGSR